MFLNKFTLIGIALIIIGIPLSVIWIGIPIMVIGFLIGDFGVIYGIVQKVPGLSDRLNKIFGVVKNSYKPYFRKEVSKK